MIKKIYNILFSTRLTAILFLVFAASMGIATFIENDYGTQSSKALVYNTWWFELIMLIFVVNFIGNVFKYRLFRKEKFSVLLFHLSFVLILIGAGITRYISFEAMMPIKEGETTNLMLSEKTYFSVTVDDGEVQKGPIEKTYLFSQKPSSEARFIPLVSRFLDFIRGGNSFSINTDFKGNPIAVKYVNFVPNAFEEFVPDDTGEEFLHMVESGGNGRHDHYIKKGEITNIHNALISFENPTPGAINIFTDKDTLRIDTPFEGKYMIMTTQERRDVFKDSIQLFNLRSLYSIGNMQFVVPEAPTKGKLKLSSGKTEEHPTDMLEVEVTTKNEKKNIILYGNKFSSNPPEIFSLDGLNFRIGYGAKQLEIPFSLKLRDFQLERYAGSMSPKSFASEITVYDNGENFDFKIFMNNVLDHKGYRFFQSGYNDKGAVEETHLSVNHDVVGTWITYVGYGILFLGLILILFSRTTRFADLRRQLDKVKKKKATLSILIAFITLTAFSQDNHQHQIAKEKIDSVLNAQKVSIEHAERFGSLVIQDAGGRMKPVNTFVSELLRKVSQKDSYNGMNANQVAVSMVTNSKIWYEVPFIYMKRENSKVRDILGITDGQKYARLSDLFTNKGDYKLSDEVTEAHKKKIKNKFEQSVIAIDGRANLMYEAIAGSIFKFFPLQGDKNNKWYSYVEQSTIFKGKDSLNASYMLPVYSEALYKATLSGNYDKADEYLTMIHTYQRKVGSEVIPSEKKIQLELFYNEYDIFKSLYKYYMLAGVLMFILVIIQIFNSSKLVSFLVKLSALIVVALFIYQTIGLGIRWYISGHAPWSNGYESMIYVSWATMFFGLIFGRKSVLTIAATTFVTAMILWIAHMNWMDPSIGNLVPVLDSYWLMIHVAIIVASYGPFTLSMILGFIALILYILTTKNNKKKLDLAIKEITTINEMSLTVGLILLTIGNFLGGIWANESWGRYWGWDPKETWAFVSIMIYAFVLHMRLVPGLRSRLTFNIASVLAFATILMTYLGVNHLLSGLHSYAAGESVPVPNQIWGWLIVSIVLSALAFFKYKKYYKK